MQDIFARARTRPKGLCSRQAKRARIDIRCIPLFATLGYLVYNGGPLASIVMQCIFDADSETPP